MDTNDKIATRTEDGFLKIDVQAPLGGVKGVALRLSAESMDADIETASAVLMMKLAGVSQAEIEAAAHVCLRDHELRKQS